VSNVNGTRHGGKCGNRLLNIELCFCLSRRHTSIEAILAEYPPALVALAQANTSPSAYLQTVHAARSLFLTPAPLPAGLLDDWHELRSPSDDLGDLMAEWGIDGADRKPRKARRGAEAVGWAGEEVAADDHSGLGAWEENEDVLGPPPPDPWDNWELDRLAEMASRL